MNYLDLVNRAIFESGIDLDQLESTNFANPPRTVMYTRFKNWVNDAYREILLKRESTFLRTERTFTQIFPRVTLFNLQRPLVIGEELRSADSGVRFVVVNTYTDPLNPDVRVDVDFTYVNVPPTNFIVGELIYSDLTLPASLVGAVEYLPGWDLKQAASFIGDVDRTSMLVQTPPDGLQDSKPAMPSYLFPMIWDAWLNFITYSTDQASQPTWVSEGPDGRVYFWPRPDKPYNLAFTYSRGLTDMVNYTDTPWPIPENLQLGIVWNALRKYADFDRKPDVFLRAKKEGTLYNNKLEELYNPEVIFGPNRFWDDIYNEYP